MPTVELATILISDLVGSTGLASRVGPARADELRHEHFTLMRDAIERSGGREVKNTGDGLMVAFSSASSAVECAVSIQQAMERRNRSAEQQLHLRIGLGTGEATVEDGDYFGMPSIEAARLCDKAQSDEILTTTMTRMMATSRSGVTFESAGRLELKGIPDPVEAFSISWAPVAQDTTRIPLPTVLRSVPPVSYIGRVEERTLLTASLQEASAERRRVVLLSGEPGIGKTRLAGHTALEAYSAGFSVLWGAARDELSAPYGPWVEALSHYVAHADADALARYAASGGAELQRLVPELARAVPDLPPPRESDPETERYLLFGAVVGLLEAACASSPIALVLDDLHWADRQTASLLGHVASQTPHLPLVVIGAYRESDVDRNHPLTSVLADLHRIDGVERIALAGLGVDEVVALMASVAGHEMDRLGTRLAAEIVEETGGNPFFVGEMLHHLTESGAIAQGSDGRWRLNTSIGELGLPQSVRDVVGRRVERLGDELRELLTAAAVIGRAFDVELLALLLRRDEDELLDALDKAIEAAVLVESPDRVGRYNFANALINHTLYSGLGATRRARMHQRVAEALEELCGDDPGERLPELAHHWSQARAPVSPSKAIGYARRAGGRALAELAPDEALRWFNNALELLPTDSSDTPERCDLLIGIGEAQRQVGDGKFRSTLLAASGVARRIDDRERLVRAVLANTRGWHTAAGAVDAERVDALEAARDVVAAGTAERARLLAQLAAELTFSGDFARVRALVDEGLTLARAAGERRQLGNVLGHSLNALLGSATTTRERWELSGELTSLADEVADPQLQMLAGLWRLPVAIELAEVDAIERAHERLQRISEEVGQPTMRWASLYHTSTRAYLAGDLERAEAAALEAAGLGFETGQADAQMIVGVQLFAVRHEQGRLDELVDIIAQRAAENPGIPTLHATLAFTYAELGRIDEAEAIFARAADDDFAALTYDFAWLPGIARYADIAARLGAADSAGRLYERLLPFRDQVITSVFTVNGSTERVLGVLASTRGEWDTAIQHFAAAEQAHERLGAPLLLARTWTNRARALLARGGEADTGRARAVLERAQTLARAHGGVAIEREADALVAEAVTR